MTGTIDAATLDLPCPKCSHKTKKTIGWVKTNRQFTCRCGTVVVLKANQFRTEIAKITKAIDKLGDVFKKR